MTQNKLFLFVLLIVNCSLLLAQHSYEYEPSASKPFGLPNPEAPSEIKDYQPMIGICDCKSVRRDKDGNWPDTVSMSWEFKYIMNGLAVQDLTLKADGAHAGSIRQFDQDSSRWNVHYYTSLSPSPTLGSWHGGKVDDDIVLYKTQKAPNGMDGKFKITFKDISDAGFNWTGEWVTPDESFKLLTWTIECMKRE